VMVPCLCNRAKRKGEWVKTVELRARDALEFCGISDLALEQASVLSHGDLKRLELARCLAVKPELILCDEVFSGLSMSEIASMVPLIERLQMDGITIIMIEHRLRELFQVANRVMVLNFGVKLVEGTAEEVMANEKVKEAYFGSQEVEEVMTYA